MHNKPLAYCAFLVILITASFLVACSGGGSSENHTDARRTTVTEVRVPEASGSVTYGGGSVSIDASNTSEGYVMVKYSGSADRTKLQITVPDGDVYSYTLHGGDYSVFPLSGGNGGYKLDVLEHAYGDMYALVFSQSISVTLDDEFGPFLYPNQYVMFTADSEAVKYGRELSDNSSNDLDYVEQVYNYVIDNISYDEEAAANVSVDYLPDMDRTMETEKGICFDYASLMSGMLRSQGIPTKLVVGYSGTAYHAWISVYLKEVGWVDNIIEFDGKNWSLMDPTLAADNDSSSVSEYIGDGSNYTAKYWY
ncbi:MAG: transglutaminase-like domain-containing protein [Bacillota bacterium]|nr:transglutaminase-like domain-containing protein [Bacillota bacterium]